MVATFFAHEQARREEIMRGIFVGLALLGALMFNTAANAAAEGKRIALFVGPTQDKYLGALSRSIADTATAAGMKVTTFSSPFDPALQAQQIDDAIAQKFDLFVVQTISQKAIIPPLTRARNANIPVVLIVVPLEGGETQDLYVSYIGYEDNAFGTMAGEAMAKALKDGGRQKGKIAVIAGSMAEGKAPIRDRAFRAAIAKHPGLDVVVTEDVKWNPATAERAAGQLLARFSGQGGLDGIYGMNDSLANGAIQAAESAGLKLGTAPGALVVVGGNCQAPGVRNLEAGKMVATFYLIPHEEGKVVGARLKDFFDGKNLDKAVWLPTEPITRENLPKHHAACNY
jgi:ribose transport system substrate-binding protein